MDEKEWKEKTKLENKDKFMIVWHIAMVILSIVVTIVEKDLTWGLVALLWINVIAREYCDTKIIKCKEAIIDIQEKNLRIQSILIDDLLAETAIEIDINKIKIPKHFSKPNEKKLKEKFKYYKKHHKFESTIIIDTDYNLIDGYTSYLIAKNYNKTSVIVKLKRKENQNNENEDN